MRKASIAKLTLTAVVGLGALIGPARVAEAGPAPQNGSVKVMPTTPTTIKPIPAHPVDVIDDKKGPIDPEPGCPDVNPLCNLPLEQPNGHGDPECPQQNPLCDLPIAQPEDEPDPQPHCPDHNPICDVITQPQPECHLHEVCPDPECVEEVCVETGGTDGGDTGGTDGGDEGGTDGDDEQKCDESEPVKYVDDKPVYEECDGDEGTTGGTDGGTTGGGGRLPHTGTETLDYAVMGMGLTGIGAALTKLAKRRQAA